MGKIYYDKGEDCLYIGVDTNQLRKRHENPDVVIKIDAKDGVTVWGFSGAGNPFIDRWSTSPAWTETITTDQLVKVLREMVEGEET